jgi:transmembrane sensor
VTAGHRAVVSRGSQRTIAPVVVTEVDIVEVNRANSWRGGLLRLGGATLAELAQQFEVQTGRKLVFADPDLANLRVGGRFPGDDIEGFVQVLQEHYSVQVRRETDGTLVLDRAR